MLGIVLCGGASSRMGRDKALLLSDNETWAEKMLDKLTDLGIPSAFSVNRYQYAEYAAAFPQVELIMDNDSLFLKGPVAGILSVHLKYPLQDLFVTACDMPMMDIVVMKELYSRYLKDPGNDCFVFTNEGEPEPLCGIYSARGLAVIKGMFDRGELIKHSMKFLLDHLSVSRIPIPDNWKLYFRNINARADLNGL